MATEIKITSTFNGEVKEIDVTDSLRKNIYFALAARLTDLKKRVEHFDKRSTLYYNLLNSEEGKAWEDKAEETEIEIGEIEELLMNCL